MLSNYAIAAQPIADTRGAPYVMPVTHGQYALSMQGAAKLITDNYPSGTFAVNGQAVTLSAQRPLSVDSGSFTYTAHDVVLDHGYGIHVPSGTFTMTGQDLVFDTGFGIIWRKGEFVVTGQSVTKGISMNAQSGSYTLTGQNAPKGIIEATVVGSFTMTLQDAGVTAQLHIRASSGDVGTFKGSDIKIRGFLSAYVPPDTWTESAYVPPETWTEAA
jgi:hypothetical protein